MLITTMNDVPGQRIEKVFGEVFGLTVRSRNLGSQLGAAFKSLAGGELWTVPALTDTVVGCR